MSDQLFLHTIIRSLRISRIIILFVKNEKKNNKKTKNKKTNEKRCNTFYLNRAIRVA
jgi:hypothetical protein